MLQDNKTIKKIEEFLNKTFSYDNNNTNEKYIYGIIDILERIADTLRFEYSYTKTNISLEDFINSKILIDKNHLKVSCSKYGNVLGSGTPSISFQPQLLYFLLLNHKKEYRVLDIIHLFIKKVKPSLTILDFKKTETGAIRCYTNTRFAANTLRDYGLLKFTKKEAYKTWVLSLPGLIVASELKNEKSTWQIDKYDIKHNGFQIHHIIREAWDKIKKYDDFISFLFSICKPEAILFPTHKEIIDTAYEYLGKYWSIMNNANISNAERIKLSVEMIKKLEALPNMDNFIMNCLII
ncbi:MAG: hypothetical protein GXY77_03830 [Fibrobacter sp.]|nr:hypothetical protein [Fibrobacter sp.]